MAKFCAKCNSPLNEGDKVCGYCGTPVAAPAKAAAKKPQIDVAKLMNDPKVKKFAPVAIIAAALVVVLLIVAIASGSGAKGVAKKYMNATVKNKPDKYVDTLSSLYLGEDLDEEELEEYKENFSDNYEDELDELKDEYGDNVKIKYDVIATYDIRDKDSIEHMEDTLDDADVDYGKELKAKMVVFLVTTKGEKNETTSVQSVLLIKEDGKWKVAPVYLAYGY